MTPASYDNVATARTLLFVPGSAPARFDKALASAADLVIIDLEDAVAEADKSRARDAAAMWLRAGGRAAVRVNAAGSAHHAQDLSTLPGLPGLLAVLLPMADSAEPLAALGESLGPRVAIVPMVETAAGVLRALELASAPEVTRLAFGHLDLAVDIDSDTCPEAMLMARSTIVMASRAAGLPGPIDGVTTALDDPAAVGRDARRARGLGFTGKLCIHPRQLQPVMAAMTPSNDDVAWARKILETGGEGALRVGGQMVDARVIAKAEAIMSRMRDDQ